MSSSLAWLLSALLLAVGSPLPSIEPNGSPLLPSGSPVPDGLTRPILAPGLDASDPPNYRPTGPPSAKVRERGVRVELWVDDTTLDQGQWLKAHVRITNLRPTAIRRYCDGIVWTTDTSSIFDTGMEWTGVAATFKRAWLDEENDLIDALDEYSDYRPRNKRCGGDIGRFFDLPPGGIIEQTVVGLPRYRLADQPLPGGTFTISSGFVPAASRRTILGNITVPVTLAGGPVVHPTPGSLVDRALETPGFNTWLEQVPDPTLWINAYGGWWDQPPYPTQARFDAARAAPNGILEIGLFRDIAPGFGQVVVDPWTSDTFGFTAE
jgi:hypothetical protein